MIIATVLAATLIIRPVQVAPQDVRAVADQPQMTYAKDGTLLLTFGANDTVYFTSSKDGGRTFTEAVEVGSNGKLSLGRRRGPRIGSSKKDIAITAVFGEQGRGKDGDLVAWRSKDGGKTWSGPNRVSDEPGAAREGLHDMNGDLDGILVAAWLDLRGKFTEIVSAYSTDGGKSWSKNILVYRSPDGSVCECCHPSVAFGPFGEIGIMFRNSLRGNRDMYLAMSPDGGRSFGRSVKFGTRSWQIAACPMDGGALSFDGSGDAQAVWRSESQLYFSKGRNGVQLAQGRNPWIATTPQGMVTVWETSLGGSIYMQNGNSITSRKRLTEQGSDPVVVSGPKGTVAAWRESGRNGGIYVERLD